MAIQESVNSAFARGAKQDTTQLNRQRTLSLNNSADEKKTHNQLNGATFSLGLRAKLILPYLLLALVVAVTAAYMVSKVVLSSWTERFNNQLLTAADEAADNIVMFEQTQLATWRQIAFTQGLVEAIRSEAITDIDLLIRPIAVNNNASRIDILTFNGTGLYQYDPYGLGINEVHYEAWPLVQQIQIDPAQRYAGLQWIENEIFLFTGGSLNTDGEEPAGIVLVGLSLSDLVTQLENAVLSGVTIYSLEGEMLISTIGQADLQGLTLLEETAVSVLDSQDEQMLLRTVEPAGDTFTQVLLPFELNSGQDVAILGISLRQALLASPLYPARNVIVAIFGTAVAATMIIGYVIANNIVRPVEQLMLANQAVAKGNLDIQLRSNSKDEIGELTRSFNTMVTQLKHRRYIEDMFGRYVGDDIAQQIIDGKATLGGHLTNATVLFADIRDFTTYTENTELQVLIDELNEYYEMMQEAIESNGGIVNKFGGDSILALFGTPIPNQNHAENAVSAAYQMMDQLVELNQKRRKREAIPFRIGIGVNSGEMIVGNLGSERRREFTVLGDTVNTASRMSDLNKNTPIHTVFVSKQTKGLLCDSPLNEKLDSLGEVRVKGREVPVHIYALIHGQNN